VAKWGANHGKDIQTDERSGQPIRGRGRRESAPAIWLDGRSCSMTRELPENLQGRKGRRKTGEFTLSAGEARRDERAGKLRDSSHAERKKTHATRLFNY
jgi:hypothetical protein